MKLYYAIRIFNAFCWLNVLKNIYRFRIIRTILWMIPSIASYPIYKAFDLHFDLVITKLELLEDGKTAVVTTLSKKQRTVSTSDFQPGQQSDIVGTVERLGMMSVDLFPVRVQS